MRLGGLVLAGAVAGSLAIPTVAVAASGTSGRAAAVPAGLLPTTTTTTPTTPTSTTPAPTTTAPAQAAPAVPAAARTSLAISGLSRVHAASVSVPHRAVPVRVTITPWSPGQRVLVQGIEGHHVFSQRIVVPRSARGGTAGTLRVVLHAPRAGVVAVRVKHSASATLGAFGIERHYTVLSEAVHPGSRGRFVTLLQSRLAALHLYIPLTGVYDNGTQLALETYHRLLGQGEGRDGVDSATVLDLLAGRGAFHVRFPRQGMHAEGDLSDQVLAYVDNASVRYLLPISSGKASTPTVLGSWRVYRKQPEYTSDGMYFSNFFTGGYAIHGYDPAPDYPGSHGCMRIPVTDAIFAYNLLSIGDWVDTYYT